MKLIIWCLLENQLVLFVHVEGMWGEWWREKFQSWLISVIVRIIRFFLTNSREAAFPLCSWKQSCQCTKSRGSLGMELKMTQGLCSNLEDPVISCFHGCTSLDSRSGREGKQFIVRMQFYWSSCAGLLLHRIIWCFAGVTATTWRFRYFLVELLLGFSDYHSKKELTE